MSDLIKSIKDLPDVSFIDSDSIEAMMQRLVTNYEKRYKEITGVTISLAPGDPMRVLLYAVALDLFHIEEYVDRAGKQDLLKYSYGEFLDNLAANRSVTREQPAAARTTLRFTLSEARSHAVGVPAGTKVTNSDGIYFTTDEYVEAPAGSTYVDVEATCTVTGLEGNGFLPGQVNVIVDPLPYIESVSNITTTDGGATLEDDESLAERVYLAPSGYSTSGPKDAYTYWTRTFSINIGSVKPTSPEPGKVVIYFLMKDGSLPGTEMINGLEEYLAQNEIRPMTDLVSAAAPTVAEYAIDLTYYVNESDRSSASTIQREVDSAVADYISWQNAEIGRDINPDALIQRIKAAGAKRVEISSPVFTPVGDAQVAQCTGQDVKYGGLEDD